MTTIGRLTRIIAGLALTVCVGLVMCATITGHQPASNAPTASSHASTLLIAEKGSDGQETHG